MSQVDDGNGNIWLYTYDPQGHLVSVQAPGPTAAGLTTVYGYDTSNNSATSNALVSITSPNGAQEFFTYDAQGRLSGTSQNDGLGATTEVTTNSYPGEAEVVTTDAAGDTNTVWFNDSGLPARVQSPLGGITTYVYDSNGNLVSTTDPAGFVYQYTYNSSGKVTQTVNPLGQTVNMTYSALGEPDVSHRCRGQHDQVQL